VTGPRRASDATLVFRGPPTRLSAPIPAAPRRGADDLEARATGPVDVGARVVGADVHSVAAHTTRRERPTTLRLRLSATTPPGRYEGVVQIGERVLPMAVEVEAHVRLDASPRPLRLRATPNEQVRARVILTNVGNVACDVSGRSTVGVIADGALGRAFWRALTFREPNGRHRLDRFVDDLAEEAGSLRVTVASGSGRLEPGESRPVTIAVRVPDALVAGRTYVGTWEPEGLRLPVRVDVVEPIAAAAAGGGPR
jgi:hypothetical protein